MRNKLKDV